MASVKSDLKVKSTNDSVEVVPDTNYSLFEDVDQKSGEDPVDPGHARDSEERQQVVWWKVQGNCCRCADITVTVLIIVAVWMMMALPTVIYIKRVVGRKPHTDSDVDFSTNETCTPFGKNNSHFPCTVYLQQYTNCLRDSMETDSDVYISHPLTQQTLTETNKYIGLLRSLSLRQQCLLSVEPLICLNYINLCDYDESLGPISLIRPSKKQCAHVLNVCDEEIESFIMNQNDILPMCAPSSPLDDKNCTTHITNYKLVNCSKGFFYDNTSCKPECGAYTPYPKKVVLITDILVIFSSATGAVAGIAVLVVSWLRRQKLCRYPSILVICQTIPALVLAILVLVAVNKRKVLFCRSQDLLQSVVNPTIFCIISGIALYYIVIQLMLWWLCHTIAVFWSVNWSIYAKKLSSSKKHRYILVSFVLLSITLPIVPVLLVLFVRSEQAGSIYNTTLKSGFTLSGFPPILCTGVDLHVNFWAAIFPTSLILAIGTNLLILILRTVIKKHILSKKYGFKIISSWSLEIKVLLVLVYYVIIGAAVLTVLTHDLITLDHDAIESYFSCEAVRYSNTTLCSQEKQNILSMSTPIPTALSLVFFGFLPVVNLVYVVKIRDLRSKIKTYSHTRYLQYIRNGANRVGRYLVNEHKTTSLLRGSHTNTGPSITPQSNYDSYC